MPNCSNDCCCLWAIFVTVLYIFPFNFIVYSLAAILKTLSTRVQPSHTKHSHLIPHFTNCHVNLCQLCQERGKQSGAGASPVQGNSDRFVRKKDCTTTFDGSSSCFFPLQILVLGVPIFRDTVFWGRLYPQHDEMVVDCSSVEPRIS